MERLSTLFILTAALLLGGLFACQPDGGGERGATDDRPRIEAPPLDTSPYPTTERKAGFAEDYLSTNRGIWQKPELVLNLLGDLEGKTIADIGAGTGFFSLRLTPKAEKVIAIDIDPRFVNFLDSLKTRELPPEMQPRLETRLAKPDDPLLAPEEADVVLIVNTYMYLKNRVAYLENLHKGISPGGTLLIIDFKKKRTPVGPPSEVRIPLYQVEEDLYEAGYRNIQTNDTALDYQYIVIAEK